MNPREILERVDHTIIKQTATLDDVYRVCDEVVKCKCCLAMIPSSFVKEVREKYGESIRIGTVVGFPNGNCSTFAKFSETAMALADCADEIDTVINIERLKSGDTNYVENEIRMVNYHPIKKGGASCFDEPGYCQSADRTVFPGPPQA